MQNPLNSDLWADQPFPNYYNYNKQLGLCLEHTGKFHPYLDHRLTMKRFQRSASSCILTLLRLANQTFWKSTIPYRRISNISISKNVLIELNCIDHCVVTSFRNSLSNKLLLALDGSHQELTTMMYDLKQNLVLRIHLCTWEIIFLH